MTLTVTYADTQFSGTKLDIAQKMRQPPHYLSIGAIATLLGTTRSYISLILKDTDVSGRRYSRITKEQLTGLSDEEIMILMSGPAIWTAAYHRTKVNLPKVTFVNVYLRRQTLIRYLFGNESQEGLYFHTFFKTLIDLLVSDEQKDLFDSYYYGGLKSYGRDRIFIIKNILVPKLDEQNWNTAWAVNQGFIT